MTAPPVIWLTTRQFAAAADISRVNAHKALNRCLAGGSWRGHQLAVAAVLGNGGRSGLILRVREDSLPTELREKAAHLFPELAAPTSEVVPMEKPGQELTTAAEGEVMSPPRQGPQWPRKPRSDRGRQRVHLSMAADAALRAAGFSDETIHSIAAATRRDVRSLWAQDCRGWQHVQRLALPKLMERLREAGFDGSDAECRAIATLPRGFIDRERGKGLAVARATKDAKADADRKPRVRRDWSRLAPGYCLIGDVHPLDILYRRTAGSTATPKAVCWMDPRSRFLIVHPVFLEANKGIRGADVATSFAQAVVDYGLMPNVIYVDNGGEYNWTEYSEVLAGFKNLAANPRVPLEHVNDKEARRIIRAKPHNPQSKPIEPRFRALENACRGIKGWIGGNRMAKKTANQGRAPEPHPDPWVLFNEIQRATDYLNNTPMPVLGGLTPAQVFRERERYEVDQIDLQVAFAKPVIKKLRHGVFTINKTPYGHDALYALSDVNKVRVYLPTFGDDDDNRLAVHDLDGHFLCHAEPDQSVDPLNGKGAQESHRRQQLYEWNNRQLQKSVDPVDVQDRMGAYLALNPEAPVPKPATALKLTGEKARAADDRKALADEPAALSASEEAPEPNWFSEAQKLDREVKDREAKQREAERVEQEELDEMRRQIAREEEDRAAKQREEERAEAEMQKRAREYVREVENRAAEKREQDNRLEADRDELARNHGRRTGT